MQIVHFHSFIHSSNSDSQNSRDYNNRIAYVDSPYSVKHCLRTNEKEMDRKKFFAGVRKKFIQNNLVEVSQISLNFHTYFNNTLFQNNESCPKCQSMGQSNRLRFFFLNLNEAVYKCSNTRCMYPFDNFRFKNFKDNTVYVYEKTEHNGNSDVSQVQAENYDLFYESPKKIDSPVAPLAKNVDEMQDTIEEFDFNILDGLFDDTTYAPHQPSTVQDNYESFMTENNNNQIGASSEQFDVNSFNELLDDLIASSSKANNTQNAQNTVNEGVKQENVIAENSSQNVFNTVDVDSPSTSQPPVNMPRPKLIKCLKHIENNLKTPDTCSKTFTSDSDDSPTKSNCSSTIDSALQTKASDSAVIDSEKTEDTSKKLLSIIQARRGVRPLGLLQQLNNLDISEAKWKALRDFVKISSQKTVSIKNPKQNTATSIELYRRIREKIRQRAIEMDAEKKNKTKEISKNQLEAEKLEEVSKSPEKQEPQVLTQTQSSITVMESKENEKLENEPNSPEEEIPKDSSQVELISSKRRRIKPERYRDAAFTTVKSRKRKPIPIPEVIIEKCTKPSKLKKVKVKVEK